MIHPILVFIKLTQQFPTIESPTYLLPSFHLEICISEDRILNLRAVFRDTDHSLPFAFGASRHA